jgi:predicted HAD superfamily hydrolase
MNYNYNYFSPIEGKAAQIFDRISALFLNWASGRYPDDEFQFVVENDEKLIEFHCHYKNLHEFYSVPYPGNITIEQWNSRSGEPRRSKRLQRLQLLHHDN